MAAVRAYSQPAGKDDCLTISFEDLYDMAELKDGGVHRTRRYRGKQPNIIPHTVHAGDPYYIGDVYEPSRVRLRFSENKRKSSSGFSSTTYLDHLDYLTDNGWPQLRYLADFMRVTTSPPKWRFLSQDEMEERAARTKIALLVFYPGRIKRYNIDTSEQLEDALIDMPSERDYDNRDDYPPHLFVAEDLSRDVIEHLGARLDVDPMFFRGHISDYVWYNIRDPWIELPDLDIVSRNRSSFSIRYAQTRYFQNGKSLNRARDEAGGFNVLRRVDRNGNWKPGADLQGSEVGTVRSKMSFWVQPRKSRTSRSVVAILLVDPPVADGFPIWGGYNSLVPCPSIHQDGIDRRSRGSVFDEAIYRLEQMSTEEIRSIPRDPRILFQKPLCIACSEWIMLIKYANTRFSQLEWEVEDPELRNKCDGLGVTLDNLHTWRRRFPIYKDIVSAALEKIIRREKFLYSTANSLRVLEKDFDVLLNQLDDLHNRAERMMSVVTAVLSIEESQKALQQNRSLGRLTYLAALFVPLSFISSFFSMSDDVAKLKKTFWIYFVVAVPVTLLALLATRYSHNINKVWVRIMKRARKRISEENIRWTE
ncbi:MAG: hypothetical protein Q9201_002009 [Fulgogasparrea decipioides]